MRPDMYVGESWDGKTVTVRFEKCLFCRKPAKVEGIPADAFSRWYSGGVAAQNALPMLSADDREILVSGSHGTCLDTACAKEPADGSPAEEGAF